MGRAEALAAAPSAPSRREYPCLDEVALWMAGICDSLSLHFLSGKNKRVGKQLASQKILQLLHPHVKNWGSLLRMYGRESSKMVKQVMGSPAGTGGRGQSQALAAWGGDGVRARARGGASRPHTDSSPWPPTFNSPCVLSVLFLLFGPRSQDFSQYP